MTCRGRAARASGKRSTLAAVAFAAAVGALAPPARAQSPEELQAARELFQEAFQDEQARRYTEALEKFERVAKVKESASVRYRIATVLVGLGRLREARNMYRALAASKASLPPSDHETADSAAEKAAELDRRIPKLALRVQDDPPADVRVTLDGAPVPVATEARSIELDPGDHVIAATAQGSRPLEETVTLTDGAGEVSHTLTFTPDKAPEPAPAPPPRSDTLAWVAVGGGAALALAGAGLLLAREGAIGDVEQACPGNVCPTSRRDEVEGNRDRAALFGPLGAGLGLAGLAAVGAGIYLLARGPRQAQGARIVTPTVGGLRLALTF